MHAWADISHQLNYKQSPNKNFERKLNQLSPLFEIADTHFVNLKESKILQIKEILDKNENYDNLQLDEDLLNQILKKYISRKESDNYNEILPDVVQSLEMSNISPKKLIEYLTIIKEEDIEKIESLISSKFHQNFRSSKIGYLRLALIILNDDFFKTETFFSSIRDEELFFEIRKKYQEVLNKE